jgi:hypothetical protein
MLAIRLTSSATVMREDILRRLATAGIVALIVYLGLITAIFIIMRQPPDRFGRIMARMPMALFMFVPFKALWSVARAGDLKAGEVAPDFDLPGADGSTRVRLSSFRGNQPVALVFGSYT